MSAAAAVRFIGAHAIAAVSSLGELASLAAAATAALGRQIFRGRFRFRESLDQCYRCGVESLGIIVFCLTFIALMLVGEFALHMRLVLGQDSLVPSFSTILLVRELGPVVTCLLLVSRLGAGISAEIGTMKIREQLDSLRLLAVDPVEYLAVPRWVGSVFAAVTLTVLSLGVASAGAAMLGSPGVGVSAREYLNTMFVFTRPSDFAGAVVKAFVFGTALPLVAVHHGFQCRPGSRGVGEAATRAVVHGSVLVIALDFVLTYWLYAL